MTTKDILQIILIPILTLGLTESWKYLKKRRTRNVEKDKEVFQSIKDIFEEDMSMFHFFGTTSGRDLVLLEYIERIWALQEELYRPGFYFTINRLEKLRLIFRENIDEYVNIFSQHYFPRKKRDNYYQLRYYDDAKLGIDPDAIEKFDQLCTEVKNLARKINEVYEQLAKVARKKL